MPPDKKGRPGGGGPPKITATKRITGKATFLGVAKADIEMWTDLAINSGAVIAVIAADLILVPDTMLMEAEANGNPYTVTTLLRRADGRTAAIYRFPEVTS